MLTRFPAFDLALAERASVTEATVMLELARPFQVNC